MRTTLKQAKESRISAALSICSDGPEFLSYLNEAQQRLINEGRWWGTIQRARFCVDDGCLTWPREVGSIEAIAVCRTPITVQNEWYEFIQNLGGIQNECPECGAGANGNGGWNCACSNMNYLPHGTRCIFRDWAGNRYMRAYPTNLADVGKTMLIQGYDENGIWIRTQVDGQWVDGEQITLAMPYVQSSKLFKQTVSGIQRQQTTNNVLLYAYDASSSTEIKIGDYQPTEENPDYITSLIPNLKNVRCNTGQNENGDCCRIKTISALVKLNFIPALIDTDWLLIGNLPALKEAMKAVQLWEQGNDDEAEIKFYGRLLPGGVRRGGALGLLRQENRNRTSDVQEVMVQTQGTAQLNRVFGGFI